jgi:hypothetical protein
LIGLKLSYVPTRKLIVRSFQFDVIMLERCGYVAFLGAYQMEHLYLASQPYSKAAWSLAAVSTRGLTTISRLLLHPRKKTTKLPPYRAWKKGSVTKNGLGTSLFAVRQIEASLDWSW